MSIRLRQVGDRLVALCGVETDPLPGDVYLDDGHHYALAAKFAEDWQGQTVDWGYPEQWAAMASQKVRDAGAELRKFLDAQPSARIQP